VVHNLGKVVSPNDYNQLAAALLEYINNPDQVKRDSQSFQEHVITTFGAATYIKELEQFYRTL